MSMLGNRRDRRPPMPAVVEGRPITEAIAANLERELQEVQPPRQNPDMYGKARPVAPLPDDISHEIREAGAILRRATSAAADKIEYSARMLRERGEILEHNIIKHLKMAEDVIRECDTENRGNFVPVIKHRPPEDKQVEAAE